MKMKLLNLLNRILKKFAFLGIFSFTTSAHAQTIYQCMPCPNGTKSQPNSTSASDCFSLTSRARTNVRDFTTSNGSVELAPGWYRISMRTPSGAGGFPVTQATTKETLRTCSSSLYGNCTSWSTSTITCKGCSANGGAGGKGNNLVYVIYLADRATATYTYNNGAPRLTVGGRTFSLSKATNGGNASVSGPHVGSCKHTNMYGNCTSYNDSCYSCSAGGAGASSQKSVSGTQSTDTTTSSYDGFASGASCRITRL